MLTDHQGLELVLEFLDYKWVLGLELDVELGMDLGMEWVEV